MSDERGIVWPVEARSLDEAAAILQARGQMMTSRKMSREEVARIYGVSVEDEEGNQIDPFTVFFEPKIERL